MEVEHADPDLASLETDRSGRLTAGHGAGVDRAFLKVMQQIRAAPDERTFYSQRSLHFEKLKGRLAGRRSFRLDRQWRLIVELRGKAPNKRVVVVGIEDYH